MARLFPQPLKNALARIAMPMLKQYGFYEARLISDWPLIAGERLAAVAVPVKLTLPRGKQDGATLTVAVHPAYALEMQQSEPALRERIATYAGFNAVARIVFEQRYLALPESSESAHTTLSAQAEESASDNTLENVLERLTRARASR